MVYIVGEVPFTQFVIFIRIEYFRGKVTRLFAELSVTDKMKHGSVRFLSLINKFP